MEKQLSDKVHQCVPRWLGHVKRMDEEHMAKKVMISNVEGNKCLSRLGFGWVDDVKRTLEERVMSVEPGRQYAMDRRRELIVRSERQ